MRADNLTDPKQVPKVLGATATKPEVAVNMVQNGSHETTLNATVGEPGVEWVIENVDLVVVVVYLVGALALGLWYGWRRRADPLEYFLAGRESSWPLVGLSIYASNISSTSLVGLAGNAYAYGIAVYSYEWMAVVVLVMIAAVMLPGLVRAKIYTLPELLHHMYCPAARYYFSALNIFINVILQTAGSLYAGALLLQVLLPGWAPWHIMAALAVMAGLYTVLGGLTAVMVTDAVQALILGAGSIAMTVSAVQKAGGWSAVLTAQPPGYVSIIRPLDDPSVPWLGLPGVFLLGFYFFATNQFMAQRLLSVKSVEHGQWGVMLAAALKLPGLFIMVLPGLAARVLYPELEKPDMVYPTLLFDMLPPGMRGLVLSGFLAALMSMLDSTMNGVATLVTMDFVRLARPSMSQKQLLLVGQGVTVAVMVLAVGWAPQIQYFSSLYQYLQKILAYTVSPVLALYMAGVFWGGGTPCASIVTLVTGTLVGVAVFLANEVFDVIHLHFLYMPPLLLVLSALVLITVSLLSRNSEADCERFRLWSFQDFQKETEALRDRPLWQNYRVHSLFLLIVTATIIGIFW